MRLSLLFVLLWTGCTTETAEDKDKALLLGRWDIQEAIRNGKITEALDGIYFEFLPESKMISNFNLSVEDRQSPYTLKEKILTEQSAVDANRTFAIEQIDEQNLILSTEYQGMQFKLHLNKSK